jgi:uncharacterized membrane protein YvlD (DUF360 family)
MKRIFRIFAVETIALFLTHKIAQGLIFQDELSGLLTAGVALAIAAITVKPIIKILILPLTIAPLGLLKFLANAITLYIVDLALPQFQVTQFSFPGLSSQYLDLPAVSFAAGPMAYLAFSLLISFISTLIHWISK